MPPQTPDPLNPNPTPNPVPTPAPAPVPAQPAVPSQPPATASAHVDLTKIILPKKPGTPSVDSAQRINAGVLFEQERTATLPEPEKSEEPAAKPQPPKADQPLVRPLQTYQGDIESLVGEKQVSVVSIAAAEAQRRGLKPLEAGQAPLNQEGRPWLRKALIILAGIALLAGAGGIGFYIYARSQPVPLAQQSPAPFISVDDTQTVVLQPGDLRSDIMNALAAKKAGVSLSLGLVARIQIARPGPLNDGTLVEVSAPEFLQTLAPSTPAQLVRTLEPQMLLGIHSFDENQAFMILKADSYETAYSGMLAWEESIRLDLMPLFARTPAVRPLPVPAPIIQTGTTTASSTPGAVATEAPPAPFFQGNFIDQIVENHDARVLLNQNGDILLLWTFLDRSTIVITTNEATLREVISRITQASTLSLPPSR
jgi:hypothetical protein